MDTSTCFKKYPSSCSKQSRGYSIREQAFSFGSLPTVLTIVSIMLSAICCQQIVADRVAQNSNQVAASNKNLDQSATTNLQHALGAGGAAGEPQNGALEAELNSIVQQHDALESNNKMLAEAIIARLMVDNLTGSSLLSGANELENEILSPEFQAAAAAGEPFGLQEQAATGSEQATAGQTGLEAMRLRKLMSILHNYESSSAGGGGLDVALAPYPILPASQAATMKRAAMKMGNYLQQQQRHSASPYMRNNFDFGLGKRPDSTVSSNILRFGDGSLGDHIQPVSQFGKRPSSHRYDFGLGKRVASPAYPRYDFGLGKRAPNRIRYDFGLGK